MWKSQIVQVDRKLNETDANDDGDNDATPPPHAWHCTLSTLTSTSTERAHVVLFLAHFLPHTTLYFPAFLLSFFLFIFFHLSDEQQPELN